MALLEVRGLTKRYADLVALADLDLDVDRGRCVALLGHNGSGKSTALRAIGGHLEPTAGQVRVDGVDILAARDPVASRATRSMVHDAPAFYPDLTVREHVELVATAHGLGRDVDAAVDTLLAELELTHRAGHLPQMLSAGMRQKTQLACGLVRPFDLLLLDEPAQHLDRAASGWLHRRLAAERDRGAGVLLSTHDPAFVRALADEVVVLVDGEVGARGPVEVALASEAAARAGLDGPGASGGDAAPAS